MLSTEHQRLLLSTEGVCFCSCGESRHTEMRIGAYGTASEQLQYACATLGCGCSRYRYNSGMPGETRHTTTMADYRELAP